MEIVNSQPRFNNLIPLLPRNRLAPSAGYDSLLDTIKGVRDWRSQLAARSRAILLLM